MKQLFRITLIVLVFVISNVVPLVAQPIGHTTTTFVDPSRNNRQIATEIYYPATSAGDNTPIAPGAFPLIVYGHGFVMVWSAYENIWTDLVPGGYIVAFPKTEGGFSPSHANFGLDMKFIISEMQQNGAGASVPAASVGKTAAVMGHSMGGGCAFLAAENDTTITTMVSFAAANTNPSSIAAAQQVTIPTLLFSGVNDCVAPPAQQQDLIYDAVSAVYKTQVYISGGGHCYFAENNVACSFGESTCSPSPTITREQQQTATSDFLKLWLERFLKDDCSKGQAFQDSLATSSRITYRQSQSVACVSGVDEKGGFTNTFNAFPNPFNHKIQIENLTGSEQFHLTNSIGQLMWTGKHIEQQDFSRLPNDFYFLMITVPGGRYTLKMLKQ